MLRRFRCFQIFRQIKATAEKPFLATPLWGMFYANDTGIVSQSHGQLRKMMGMIVIVCAVLGLTVPETKTEVMGLRRKGMSKSTAIFSLEAAGQVCSQKNEFVYLGGNINNHADLSMEVDRCLPNAWCSFRKYTLEVYDRLSTSFEFKLRMLRAEVLEMMMHD